MTTYILDIEQNLFMEKEMPLFFNFVNLSFQPSQNPLDVT